MDISYKQLLPNISTFIFDVDGVLTNGMLTIMPDGELVRHMNVKDGYAIKIALNTGFRVCIISGGTNQAVKSRLAALGISDIYLGAHNKIQQYNEIVEKYNLNPEHILYMVESRQPQNHKAYIDHIDDLTAPRHSKDK